MKAARGFEAVGVGNSFPFFSVPELAECEAQPTSTLICLECESVVPQEPAPYPSGVEVGGPEVGVLPSLRRICFNKPQEGLNPWRCSPFGLHWMTSQTGPESGHDGISHRWIELHVFGEWLFCGAARPAEDAGCSYRGEKHAVECFVPFKQGAIHAIGRRKRCHRHGTQSRDRIVAVPPKNEHLIPLGARGVPNREAGEQMDNGLDEKWADAVLVLFPQ